MFKKTVCLFALAALSYTQDVTSQQVNDIVNSVVDAAQSTTLGDAVSQVQNQSSSVDLNSFEGSVPVLGSLTVGWGPREVVVTPQTANPTFNDWVSGTDNVERRNATWDEGEWTLQWSVENGDDYALLHQDNGDFVIADWTTGTSNSWGANDALDAEIANGAEQLVDYVWNNEVDTVNGQDITNWLANVLNNDNVNNFLANNNDQSVATAANNAVNQATGATDAVGTVANQANANAGQIATSLNDAVSNSQSGQVVDAVNQAVDNASNGSA